MAQNTFAKRSSKVMSSAKKIPSFSLKDADGHMFTSEGLFKNGLVLVVTAPIMKNKGAQEGWEKHLTKARSGSKAKWVYLEDLSPSLFKGIALKRMKKEYKFGEEPILLIDKNGAVSRSLGVAKKQTMILVYNKDGELVHSQTGKPSAQTAMLIWKKTGE